MTDRLDLAAAFEGAGLERKTVEHVAGEIFDAIRENVATKSDLAELRAELKSEIAAAKADVLKWMFAQTVVTIGGLAALFRLPHWPMPVPIDLAMGSTRWLRTRRTGHGHRQIADPLRATSALHRRGIVILLRSLRGNTANTVPPRQGSL